MYRVRKLKSGDIERAIKAALDGLAILHAHRTSTYSVRTQLSIITVAIGVLRVR